MAQYRAHHSEIVLREKLLEPENMRGLTQVVLAHELEHYLLGHKARGWYNDDATTRATRQPIFCAATHNTRVTLRNVRQRQGRAIRSPRRHPRSKQAEHLATRSAPS